MSNNKPGKRIPDQIYLQIYGADQRDMRFDEGEPDEVTWCGDQIYDTDELYVRQVKSSRRMAKLRRENEHFRGLLRQWREARRTEEYMILEGATAVALKEKK